MNQSKDKAAVYYVGSMEGSCLDKILEVAGQNSTENKDITIVIKEGDYYLDSSLKLCKDNCRITLKAEGKVRLIGGKKLSGIGKVSDDTVLKRFNTSVRRKILQCNLTDNGIKEPGNFISRGFNRAVSPSHSELFVDSIPFSISQYPKKGKFIHITGYLQEEINEWGEKAGNLKAGFKYDCKRPKQWEKSADIWVHGYWSWDWANSYERVAELNVDEMTVKTAPPYGNYAFKTGQRFCFLNILEEVTEPGDYYIDRKTNILYFYPFDNSECKEVIVTVLDEPLIEIDSAENIKIEGLTFEAVRGHALKITNASNINIDNCIFKNIGNNAADVTDCKNVLISACTIHDAGDGGVSVISGDRKSLSPANITIHNNHIYNIAKWTRCYQTAINITGVGISTTHNLIHDCPHTAILYWGNDITIENNEIYNVVMETGDAGAVYTGRDYTFRGNRVCKNFIHHLGGVGMGTMGIYNDDCVSGTLMQDNYFLEVSRAVFLGGGRDFLVKNNVFVNCYPAIEIDGRGSSVHKVWRSMVDDLMKNRFYDIGGNIAPYIEKYPELADIDSFYKQNSLIPPSAVIENNIYCSDRKLEFSWDSEKGTYLVKNNYCCSREDFEDFDYGNFKIKPGSAAFDYGYSNVDFHAIGLITDDRNENPPEVSSCLEVNRHTGMLILSLKNKCDKRVAGRFIFHTDTHVDNFSETSVKFELSAYDIKKHEVSLPQNRGDLQIEARSNVAGVRPCRVQYKVNI